MANIQNQKTSHQHKDTLFRTLFGDSRNFLELYNAVANENLPDGTEVTPHPSNELLAKFNDLAASIGNRQKISSPTANPGTKSKERSVRQRRSMAWGGSVADSPVRGRRL